MNSPRKLILLSALMLVPTGPRAQETCGLQDVRYELPDGMFRNGFENTVALAAHTTPAEAKSSAKGAGLGPPLTTVNPPTLGVTPSVTITSPAAGSSVGRGQLQVEGVFTGPQNTGISVNGIPVLTIGNSFVSPPLTIDTGSQTITVTATTMDGLLATASRSVTITALPAQNVKFSSTPSGGFAPFKVQYSVRSNELELQSVAIDFDGNGTDDFTGAADAVPIHTYMTSGIYNARATITAVGGQTYVLNRRVVATSLPETRARACSAFALFKARLTANDSAGALLALHKQLAFDYVQVLDALGSNRPTFASRLGTIGTGVFSPTNAELVLITEEGSEFTGTPIHLSAGGDGVWRIDGL